MFLNCFHRNQSHKHRVPASIWLPSHFRRNQVVSHSSGHGGGRQFAEQTHRHTLSVSPLLGSTYLHSDLDRPHTGSILSNAIFEFVFLMCLMLIWCIFASDFSEQFNDLISFVSNFWCVLISYMLLFMMFCGFWCVWISDVFMISDMFFLICFLVCFMVSDEFWSV